MDQATKVSELKNMVDQFVMERDWGQFHNPKDLAIGLITESSELIEHFRFKDDREVANMLNDPDKRAKIGEELADVLYFILLFSSRYDFDLSEMLITKLAQNRAKYPIAKFKGSNKKYTEI